LRGCAPPGTRPGRRRSPGWGSASTFHLASPEIGLDTHVLDVANVLGYEDLQDAVLVGHSYGGMVITGVAERVPERLAHLVYLDALVPADGQAMTDFYPPAARAALDAAARAHGDGWRVPVGPEFGPRATPHLLPPLTQPLAVRSRGARWPPRRQRGRGQPPAPPRRPTHQEERAARRAAAGLDPLPEATEPRPQCSANCTAYRYVPSRCSSAPDSLPVST
jgi:pimeloyl-ACP methyl ester carboxylesterase